MAQDPNLSKAVAKKPPAAKPKRAPKAASKSKPKSKK